MKVRSRWAFTILPFRRGEQPAPGPAREALSIRWRIRWRARSGPPGSVIVDDFQTFSGPVTGRLFRLAPVAPRHAFRPTGDTHVMKHRVALALSAVLLGSACSIALAQDEPDPSFDPRVAKPAY